MPLAKVLKPFIAACTVCAVRLSDFAACHVQSYDRAFWDDIRQAVAPPMNIDQTLLADVNDG